MRVTYLFPVVLSGLLLAACGPDSGQRTGEAPASGPVADFQSQSAGSETERLATLELESDFLPIVYVDRNYDVYTTDPSGSERRPVTDFGESSWTEDYEFNKPVWSPDGRALAFSGRRFTGRGYDHRMFIADEAAGELRDLWSFGLNAPVFYMWGPRGESLSVAFANQNGEIELGLIPVDADGPTGRVVTEGRPMYWDWSGDSRELLVRTLGAPASGEGARIQRIDVDTDAGPTTYDLELGGFQTPSLSPSGERFLVSRLTPEGQSLVEAPVGAPRDARILSSIAGYAAFDWSPDGERVALLDGLKWSNGITVGRLSLVSLEAGRMQIQFGEDPTISENASAFFFSPDGTKIAAFEPYFIRDDEQRRRIVLDLIIHYVEEDETVEVGPFIPSGYFISTVVPFFDQYSRAVSYWSPDGRTLLFSSVDDDGRTMAFTLNVPDDPRELRGILPEELVPGSFVFWRPRS